MLRKYMAFIFFFLMPGFVLAHSGGTDANGCHAGSRPYHCHNNGSSGSGGSSGSSNSKNEESKIIWDVNFGYMFELQNSEIYPFGGMSIGKNDPDGNASLGANFGIQHHKGLYMGVVTTSKSIQVGYKFGHVSFGSDYIGFGFKFSLGQLKRSVTSPFYFSASSLF